MYWCDVDLITAPMWAICAICVILLVASSRLLDKFYARKLVHLGCGIVLAIVNVPHGVTKAAILLVAISSIVTSPLGLFRFGSKFDLGIIWYNVAVFVCVVVGMPLRLLLCMFVVDPLAAILGTAVNTRKWIHTKTVFGTLIAAAASWFCLYFVDVIEHRIILTFIIPLAEGLVARYDNIAITLITWGYYELAMANGWPMSL